MPENYPEPNVRISKTAYTVWILPLLAMVLAMWLIFKNYTDKGITVFITFPDANGIIAQKTPVKFRGIEVGRVQTLTALDDGSGILAEVEMQQQTDEYLTDKLKFWLVRPNVGFQGISGLDTLLSGAYIQVDGGEEVKQGNATRFFEALIGAPPVDIASGLLVYKLVTSDASGVNKGAMIYHRNILVGEVHDVQLSDDNQSVEVTIAIEPKFKGLVKRASRFWSISGVKASFDMSGVKVEANGLVPMLIGGVAFSSPAKSSQADELTLFRLYPSADAARDSLEVKLNFTADADVRIGTGIYLNQQKVGEIDSLDWDKQFNGLRAKAKLSLKMAAIMRADTEFWLDSPVLSVDHISVGHLIQGTVIRITPGTGASRSAFSVSKQSPYKRWAKNGLHLHLTSEDTYGLSKGSGIYYKSQVIGAIQWIGFDAAQKRFTLDALIYPQYRDMLNQSSQFYNLSGIDFSAKLAGVDSGVKFAMPSFKQLLAGGIGVYLNNNQSADDSESAIKAKSTFTLHRDLTAALALESASEPDFYLRSSDLLSPASGTPIYYKQFEIGQVSAVTLATDASHSQLAINIKPSYKSLVRANSRFWLKSALDIKANIHGVKMRTGPVMSMLTGGIEVSLADMTQVQAEQGATFELYPSFDVSELGSEQVILIIGQQTTLKAGAAVKYRGFSVGEVIKVQLLSDLSGVKAQLKIDSEYAEHFTRAGAQYGLVQAAMSLNGVKNLANAVLGDHIAVQKAPSDSMGPKQTQFNVTQSNVADFNGLAITLHAEQLGSVDTGDPLLFKQLRIGEVTSVGLTANSQKIKVDLIVYPQFAHLITIGSQFFNASGVKVEAGWLSGIKIDTQTLESIVAGGIALATATGAAIAQAGQVFTLHPQAQMTWKDGTVEATE